MRGLLIAALCAAPVFGLYAEKGPALKSDVIVEHGLFKKGWEHEFFRDILPAEKPVETADTAAASPDAVTLIPDSDNTPRPRIGSSLRRNGVKEAPGSVNDSAVASPINTDSSAVASPPVAPPPAEQLLLPPHRSDPRTAPVASRKSEPQKELVPQQEPVDNKKKQKDRARELDSKRKKGNFRDPKITY